MNQRYVDESDEFFIDDSKSSNQTNQRQDGGLFDDDRYVVHKLISVRRVALPNGEDWEILVDKKPVMLLKGYRFSKKEREFLHSAQGMLLMIRGFQSGWKTISEFKRQVAKCLK